MIGRILIAVAVTILVAALIVPVAALIWIELTGSC